ncbi:MAG: putative peptidoglycan glycosyltransferase FtsW [Actinomycetota bacterium]|nr:putative peptidoglycan glycosyltransferase FtsW [Actinomycetota bacterium]
MNIKIVAVVVTLNLFGLVMVLSAGSVVASQEGLGEFSYFYKQGLWFFAGLAVLYACSKFDYRKLQPLVPALLGLTYFMFFLLHTPLGVEGGGATRWLAVPGGTFQPSEMLKLVMVLFTAKHLSEYEKNLTSPRAYRDPILALIPAMMLLFIQPDYGTMCLVAFLVATLLFLGGMPLGKFLAIGAGSFLLVVGGAMQAPYRRERLKAILDLEGDSLNTGWQTLQSLTGISNGGLLGVGPGASKSKWWTPETHTDFIFTIIAEEMGLVGSLLVLSLFVGFVALGVRVAVGASNASDKFGYLLAMGITIWFVVQAFVNIGVTIGRLPNTGLPLPFVSYGGSSLLVGMAAVGILLNISRQKVK